MRRTLPVLVASVICGLAIIIAGCATQPTGGASGADPAALIVERCTSCHDISRVKFAKHDAAGWTTTVTRMRKNGAKLTDDEAQMIIDFLGGGGASGL